MKKFWLTFLLAVLLAVGAMGSAASAEIEWISCLVPFFDLWFETPVPDDPMSCNGHFYNTVRDVMHTEIKYQTETCTMFMTMTIHNWSDYTTKPEDLLPPGAIVTDPVAGLPAYFIPGHALPTGWDVYYVFSKEIVFVIQRSAYMSEFYAEADPSAYAEALSVEASFNAIYSEYVKRLENHGKLHLPSKPGDPDDDDEDDDLGTLVPPKPEKPDDDDDDDDNKNPLLPVFPDDDDDDDDIAPLVPKPIVNPSPSSCGAAYTKNADGTVSVNVSLPLADGIDPTKLNSVQATFSGFTPQGLSYSWVGADGSVNPIAAKASATPPYLQMSFKANNLNDLKKGQISKIDYTLKDDEKNYVHTLEPALAFNNVPMTDETPRGNGSDDGSGGCNAGMGMFVLALLAAWLRKR